MWAGESARGAGGAGGSASQPVPLWSSLFPPSLLSCSSLAQPPRLCLCPLPPPGWNFLVESPCQLQAQSLRAKGEHHQQLYN